MDIDTLLAALTHFSSSLFKHEMEKSMFFRSGHVSPDILSCVKEERRQGYYERN